MNLVSAWYDCSRLLHLLSRHLVKKTPGLAHPGRMLWIYRIPIIRTNFVREDKEKLTLLVFLEDFLDLVNHKDTMCGGSVDVSGMTNG